MSRLKTEKAAAAEIGCDLATFRSWVAGQRLPKPLAECGLYDMRAIDAALDRMSGIGLASNTLDSWRAKRHAS
ncbi:MAG: hypothetical protein VX871_12705 [Pseudomonadota bacterium]|nr:hypothetical protein [Pseudomonadota bacterium]